MKKTLLFLTGLFLSCFSIGQWAELESGTTVHLSALSVPSQDIVYVGGSGGVIRKTIDGGQTWTAQNSTSDGDIYWMYFHDTMKGYAVGNDGQVSRTFDGGENWETNVISSEHLRFIYFVTDDIGFIGAGHGKIYRTENAGDDWTEYNTGIPLGIYSIVFISETHGFALGYYGELLETTNTGDSWQVLDDISDQQMGHIRITGATTAVIVGANGEILKSTDTCQDWAQTNSNSNAFLACSYFVSGQTGYSVGGEVDNNTGEILTTTNGGDSWTSQFPGTPRLYRIEFSPNHKAGYITGLDGTIMKLMDANAVEETTTHTSP